MVEDDIEVLPPTPYDDAGLPVESDMPDMGSDETTSIEGDDWKDFDMDIVTDQGNIQAKGVV